MQLGFASCLSSGSTSAKISLMPTVRRSARLFEEMVEDPGRALREPEFWRESVCRRWLDRVDDLVHHDRLEARAAGVLGVRLALRVVRLQGRRRRLRNRCLLARAVAVLASVHRADGRLDRAGALLTRAEEIAGTCRDGDTWTEVHLRRAYWMVYAAQDAGGAFDPAAVAEAKRRADAAVRWARSRTARARARNCRSFCHYHRGAFDDAAEDAKIALDLIDAAERPYDHLASLSAVVVADSRRDGTDRDETAACLASMRDALPPRSPELRARYRWAEALVYASNRRRRGRTRRLLSQALSTFVRLGMQVEATAVLAELARIKPTGPVPEWAEAVLKIVDPGPIRDLIEGLATVRMVERVDVAERLRAAVVGPRILPAAALPTP